MPTVLAGAEEFLHMGVFFYYNFVTNYGGRAENASLDRP